MYYNTIIVNTNKIYKDLDILELNTILYMELQLCLYACVLKYLNTLQREFNKNLIVYIYSDEVLYISSYSDIEKVNHLRQIKEIEYINSVRYNKSIIENSMIVENFLLSIIYSYVDNTQTSDIEIYLNIFKISENGILINAIIGGKND